jgi:tRNA(fMet)-specific endonuclease VapC
MQYSGRIYTSRLVVAELYAWAFGSANSDRVLDYVSQLLDDVRIVEFDDHAARCYGRLWAGLNSAGSPVPAIDLLIAATALANQLTVVTHDQHFRAIPDIEVVDWLE